MYLDSACSPVPELEDGGIEIREHGLCKSLCLIRLETPTRSLQCSGPLRALSAGCKPAKTWDPGVRETVVLHDNVCARSNTNEWFESCYWCRLKHDCTRGICKR